MHLPPSRPGEVNLAACLVVIGRLAEWFSGEPLELRPEVDPADVADAAVFYCGVLLARHHHDNYAALLKAWASAAIAQAPPGQPPTPN